MYQDRHDAGRQLADRLLHLKGGRLVVLALPRGGVPVGFEIAVALSAPLDLLMVRKIGAPWQPELAVGAVIDGQRPHTVLNRDILASLKIPKNYLAEETARQLAEIERRRRLYLGARPPVDVKGRTAIVVDDGIATGATMRVALQAVREAKPARLVLAAPVAPASTIEALRAEVDEVACPLTPDDFGALSMHYRDFAQLADADVIELLDRAPREADSAGPSGSS